MINVLFYHANNPEGGENNRFYLNTAALYLKTYLDTHHPEEAEQVNWLLPKQEYLDDDQLIKLCNDNDVTLLCTSHYIWSHDLLIPQLERIKNKIKAKIVSGGPSISVHVEEEFFKKYPFIDYAVYGAGEKAFADIIISMVNNKKLIVFNSSNLAYYDKEKEKSVIAKFEYVPVLNTSPYVSNKEMFTQMVKYGQALGYNVAVPFALTRGCPYACTFCDWNAGLSNKVSRTKSRYEEDIDLFAELKIKTLYLADANIGQYDDDINMIAYMAKKNIEEGAEFQVEGNMSKLKKKNNLKIYHLMAQGKLVNKYGFIFSIQDINEEVLKSIDRPDVSWEVHRAMIHELYENYPDFVPKLQLIQGLPGQTVDSWRATLKTIAQERIIAYIFVNEVLPTSPASMNPEYQEKYKFVYSHAERFTDRKSGNNFYRGTIPQSCISFTQKDFVRMVILSQIYLVVMAIRSIFEDYQNINVEVIVDKVLTTTNYANLVENLYTNWTMDDKFYYTINFNGENQLIPGDSMAEHISYWMSCRDLQKIVLSGVTDTALQKKMYHFFMSPNGMKELKYLMDHYY
jgi:tRNA A37 methylthiotransferase MiaB